MRISSQKSFMIVFNFLKLVSCLGIGNHLSFVKVHWFSVKWKPFDLSAIVTHAKCLAHFPNLPAIWSSTDVCFVGTALLLTIITFLCVLYYLSILITGMTFVCEFSGASCTYSAANLHWIQ